MNITRGFRSRASRDPRLPPGQYDVGSDWPVLTAEATPSIDTATWSFSIRGLVEAADDLDMGRVPGVAQRVPTPATSTVSPPGPNSGSPFRAYRWTRCSPLPDPFPSASHVLATSYTGYSTNLPLADVSDGLAWVAWEFEGQPLAPQHGGPARLLVPHLYFWKSAKWISRSRAPRPRRAGLLGAQRVPRPGRPLVGTALPR